MSDVTNLIQAVRAGEAGSEERLWQTVYQELRRMARERMAGESRQVTLQATALVHEAWMRLSKPDADGPGWDGRAHFFAAASEAMRRVLVDQARRRLAQKRGGGGIHVPLSALIEIPAGDDTKLIEVHEALDALAEHDAQQARIVKLCYFVGLSQKEVAALLGVSEKTVHRQWTLAKSWLFQQIKAARRSAPPATDK